MGRVGPGRWCWGWKDRLVQGRSDPQREILDVESVAGHLLPAGGVVEAVTFDLRWKAACGLAVTDRGFHPTSLTYWRRRLARSDRPNRIFDAVKRVVAETGVLTGKTRRALDSTVLDDAVATQDTITQLIAAIRRVAREVPGAAVVVVEQCRAHDYTQAGKPAIAWDDPAARDALVDALVSDAHRLLGYLPEQELDAKAGEAVALLALIAGQDVEPAEGSDGTDGRWRIARRVASERVVSTVDPQARHAHKTRSRRQDGYKAHVVVEPDTGIITDTRLTPAAGSDNSDATIGVELLLPDQPSTDHPGAQQSGTDQPGTEPGEQGLGSGWEVLADSAYATGDALADITRAGHTPIIKPWPLRPAVEGGFTLDDFPVTEPTGDQPGSVSCPNGHTRPLSRTRTATFGALCRSCPLRARCTTSKTGRSMRIHPHDAITRAHRQRAHDPQFQATYRRHRPMVERSISWLTAGGNRRLRFPGTTLNDLWLHHRVAGLNLRRLLSLGLHHTGTAWATA